MDAYELVNYTWEEMGQIDHVITEELFDHDGAISHKMILSALPLAEKDVVVHPLYNILYRSYKEAEKAVLIRPLSIQYSRDKFTSFGVFAKVFLPHGTVISSLTGFLAAFSGEKNMDNFFSVYDTKEGDMKMLGPLSFINHCCEPNCEFVPNIKLRFVTARVISVGGIQPNTQLFIRYNQNYFDQDGSGCECPFVKYHVGRSLVLSGSSRKTLKASSLANMSS